MLGGILVLTFLLLTSGLDWFLKTRKGWFYTLRPNGNGISFKGDPLAVERSDKTWPTNWKWILLETNDWNPYYVYFVSKGICMRYGPPIKTKYVALRIGPGDVTFFAESANIFRKSLPLTTVIVNMVPMSRSKMMETLEEGDAVGVTTWI